jgi:hypothetical protein
MAIALVVVGGIAFLSGMLWFYSVANSEDPDWGRLSAFVPPMMLVFLIQHWQKAWKAAMLWSIGGIMLIIGIKLL